MGAHSGSALWFWINEIGMLNLGVDYGHVCDNSNLSVEELAFLRKYPCHLW